MSNHVEMLSYVVVTPFNKVFRVACYECTAQKAVS